MSDRVLILNKANYHTHHHASTGRVVLVDNSNTSNQQPQQQHGLGLNVTGTNGGQAGSFRFVRMAINNPGVGLVEPSAPALLQQAQQQSHVPIQLQLKLASDPMATMGEFYAP